MLDKFVRNHLHNTPPILVEEVEGRVIQDLKISLVSPFCHFLPVGIHYLLTGERGHHGNEVTNKCVTVYRHCLFFFQVTNFQRLIQAKTQSFWAESDGVISAIHRPSTSAGLQGFHRSLRGQHRLPARQPGHPKTHSGNLPRNLVRSSH